MRRDDNERGGLRGEEAGLVFLWNGMVVPVDSWSCIDQSEGDSRLPVTVIMY